MGGKRLFSSSLNLDYQEKVFVELVSYYITTLVFGRWALLVLIQSFLSKMVTFSLSLSIVLFVRRGKNHGAEEQAKVLCKPAIPSGLPDWWDHFSSDLVYFDKTFCESAMSKPGDVFSCTLFSGLRDWLCVHWEYLLCSSALYQLEGAFTRVHLVASWIEWGSETRSQNSTLFVWPCQLSEEFVMKDLNP